MQRKPLPVAPTCFVPSCPADFEGQAGKVAEVLLRKAERLRANPDQLLKLLVSGAPGIGKTSLRGILPRQLVGP
jgi:Holliday junction resolvasome RuvABC ATP-dependent DNA helicase subunit